MLKFLLIILSCVANCYSIDNNSEKHLLEEKQNHALYMRSFMDTKTHPCDDFYQFACGNFNKSTPIPPGHAGYGVLALVKANVEIALHNYLILSSNTSKSELPGENAAKIFYKSCIKEDIFKHKKIDAYLKVLNDIGNCPALSANWRSQQFDWMKVLITLKTYGIDAFFHEGFNKHGHLFFKPNHFHLNPSITHESNRYHTKKFPTDKSVLRKLLKIYGNISMEDGEKVIEDIIKLENQWSEVVRENAAPKADDLSHFSIYIKDLIKEIPDFDSMRYFKALFGDDDNILYIKLKVPHLEITKKISTFLNAADKGVLANYLTLLFLTRMHDEFHPPLTNPSYCIKKLRHHMEPVLSKIYVKHHFRKEVHEEAIEGMVHHLKKAYKQIILSTNLPDEVKDAFSKKIDEIKVLIGDLAHNINIKKELKFYEDLKLSPNASFYENNLKIAQYNVLQNRGVLRSEDRHSEVKILKSALNLNTLYSASSNTIFLPVATFEKPMFYQGFPHSFNYANIGSRIGHEMGHALASQFHFIIKINNETDQKLLNILEENKKCFEDQYNNYKIPEANDQHIEGHKTLHENIADGDSVKIAFRGYQNAMKENKDQPQNELLPGFYMTNEQFFFLAYAQKFCSVYTKNYYNKHIHGDSHAINKWRVIGSLSNFEEFVETFKCSKDTPMNNGQQKCSIWNY